jgi:hypothetical protein
LLEALEGLNNQMQSFFVNIVIDSTVNSLKVAANSLDAYFIGAYKMPIFVCERLNTLIAPSPNSNVFNPSSRLWLFNHSWISFKFLIKKSEEVKMKADQFISLHEIQKSEEAKMKEFLIKPRKKF